MDEHFAQISVHRRNFFMLFGVFLLCFVSPSHQANITKICSMKATKSFLNPPLSQSWIPVQPDPSLSHRTCEMYDSSSCCNHDQTLAIKKTVGMTMIEQNLSNCPACTQNIWELTCGLFCSPEQGNFVNVTSTKDNDGQSIVNGLTFSVNRVYAEAIFSSCRGVHVSGGARTVQDIFESYDDFFNWMFTDTFEMNIKIRYVDTERANIGFIGNVRNCDQSCVCEECQQSCVPPPVLDLQLNSTLPTIEMFGKNWSYVTLLLSLVYLSAMFIFFFVISLWFPCVRYVQLRRKIFPIWMCLGIFVLLLSVAIVISAILGDGSSCSVVMFDSEWNCYTLTFVMLLLGVFFITPIVLSIYYYFALKYLGQVGDQSTKWQSIDHESSLRKKGWLQHFFYRLGRLCTRHPVKVIIASALVTAGLGTGIVKFEREVSPNNLWIYPQSRAVKDQAVYESYYGEASRSENLIITTKNGNVFDYEILSQILGLQNEISSFYVVTSAGRNVTLSDLCITPVASRGCLIESPLEYWQSNAETLYNGKNNIIDHVDYCTTDSNVNDPSCLNSIGLPIDARRILGDFEGSDFTNAKALIVRFHIRSNVTFNNCDEEAWETQFLKIVSRNFPGLNIDYSASISMKDELHKVSQSNEIVSIVSYCGTFLYISFALASLLPLQRKFFFVDSKFTLGLGAISIVISSLIISYGFCSILGIRSTLFISVILPVLILAIGLDNIFVLVDTLETTDPSLEVEHRVSEALAHAGSSMALTSLCESITFFLGAITDMPAVNAFALYAGVAVLANFLLQTTCFVAILTLDLKRTLANRMDCFPCVQVGDWNPFASDDLFPLIKNVRRRKSKGILRIFAERYYGPFILHPVVKSVVIFSFLMLLLPSIYFATRLDVGLDQRVYLPEDSYLLQYMNKLQEVSTIGQPLYIVLQDIDFSTTIQQDRMCTIPGCNRESLMNCFKYAPYISTVDVPTSWLDSYLKWSSSDTCCLEDFTTGSVCFNSSSLSQDCEPCMSLNNKNRPVQPEFYSYIQLFLASDINSNCNITGLQYLSDIKFSSNSENSFEITASRYKFYFSPLKTQSDYITALKMTYELIDKSMLPAVVYSDFFIYNGQFLEIKSIATQDLLIAGACIFFITLILMGNPVVSFSIVVVVAMIEVGVMGAMNIWNLQLNPVSLVNLLMALGISIEFCVHIGYAFTRSTGTSHDRAYRSLVEMFSVTISGFTMTKLILIIALGVTSGQIFKLYYFRMWCFVLVLALSHSLIFLPALLSIVGTDRGACCVPQPYKHNLSGPSSGKKIEVPKSNNSSISSIPSIQNNSNNSRTDL